MSNPFSLTFGMEPDNYIDRILEKEHILNDFASEKPSNYAYLITGIRGSGKTVFMYAIANKLMKKDDWIVATIGPKKDILETVASEIYDQGKLKHLFLKSEFSISFNGLSFSLKGKEEVNNVMSLLKRMLSYLKKKNKKVLIVIDEVDNSKEIKHFVEGYATLISLNYPVRLLMTGLYKNISKLQNESQLTFLFRCPRIQMGSLSIGAIANKYSSLLNVDYEKALQFAKLTKGYAYAYQVLGYYLYSENKNEIDEDILFKFDEQLSAHVYEKVYSELSEMSKKIIEMIKSDKPIKLSDLANNLDKTSKYISVYRDNLINEGLLLSSSYGYVEFALPRFEQFLKTKIDF